MKKLSNQNNQILEDHSKTFVQIAEFKTELLEANNSISSFKIQIKYLEEKNKQLEDLNKKNQDKIFELNANNSQLELEKQEIKMEVNQYRLLTDSLESRVEKLLEQNSNGQKQILLLNDQMQVLNESLQSKVHITQLYKVFFLHPIPYFLQFPL